jgi:VDE lipocalin domain
MYSEFWRIMDCAEDFTWAVFYYSGAASVAGITYRGALVCTPSGHLPEGDEVNARVDAALRECGIRRWEMFDCDNDCCADAPLSVPESGDTRLRALEGASA